MKFKIKSNWFDEGKIKKIGTKTFWVYLTLRKFTVDYYKDKDVAIPDILLLYDALNDNGFKISKSQIKKCLTSLKCNDMIDYVRIPKDNNNTIIIEFLDLPNTHRYNNTDIPLNEDYYIPVNTENLDYIINCGLKYKHAIVYLYLLKFSKEIYVSCKTISKEVGLGINQINQVYLKELEEKSRMICNLKYINETGRWANYFKVCKNYKKVDEFYNKYKKYFERNSGE